MTLTNPYSQMTRQEKVNTKKVTVFKKYEKLMKDAHKEKADYQWFKSRKADGLDVEGAAALERCKETAKSYAIKYWNEAQEMIATHSFLPSMINRK